MKRAYLLSGVVAVALIGGGAVAYAGGKMGMGAHGPRAMMMNFEQIDADKDGKITQEEIAAAPKAHFDAADTDQDGALSLEEMQAQAIARMTERAKAMSARMLERKDANGDGKISFEEMQPGKAGGKNGGPRGQMMGRMFDRVDVDDDGAISKAEFDTAQEWMSERGRGGHFGKHGGKHGGMQGGQGRQMMGDGMGGGDCDGRGGMWNQ